MRQKIKIAIQEIGVLSLVLSIVFIIVELGVTIVKGWTEPTAAPPNGNLGAPINTRAVGQTKGSWIRANNGSSGYYASLGWMDAAVPSWTIVTNGNVYANDYYIASISKWASQLEGGSFKIPVTAKKIKTGDGCDCNTQFSTMINAMGAIFACVATGDVERAHLYGDFSRGGCIWSMASEFVVVSDGGDAE